MKWEIHLHTILIFFFTHKLFLSLGICFDVRKRKGKKSSGRKEEEKLRPQRCWTKSGKKIGCLLDQIIDFIQFLDAAWPWPWPWARSRWHPLCSKCCHAIGKGIWSGYVGWEIWRIPHSSERQVRSVCWWN